MEATSLNEASATYGTFFVAGREVGLPASDVREVVPWPEGLVPLPLVPDYVLGVFDLRGEVIPVIDVAGLMGGDGTSRTENATRVAILDCGTHFVGAAVDRTGVVMDVEPADVHAMRNGTLVSGLLSLDDGTRMIQLLSAQRIAHLEEIPATSRNLDHEKVDAAPRTKLVFFEVGSITLAVPVKDALEIQPMLPLSLEAAWYPSCLGMVDLRGDSVVVTDLAEVLGLEGGSTERLVFVTNEQDVMALAVDRVVRVEDVEDDRIVDVPMLSHVRCGAWARRVVRSESGRAIYLDVAGLFDFLGLGERMQEGSGRRLLAARRAVEDEVDERLWLGVEVGGTGFIVDMVDVREVQKLPPDLLHHPGVDHRFEGLMDLRGEVLPVLDLASVLGLAREGHTGEARVLVVEDAQGLARGLVVQHLTAIHRASDGRRAALPPASLGNLPTGCIRGMFLLAKERGGGRFLQLDLQALLAQTLNG